MGNLAIQLENLGKMYHIGHVKAPYRTLRETIIEACTAPARRIRQLLRGTAAGAADLRERFWALKDVSLEIKHGEVVGLIGRNGAGKSTLLKILSRITEPTTGIGRVYGRVGSLLEVGTGFHPELTGRENIYLNGAILGMQKSEIRRKFDQIVEFAEVEKFIDTPVKHYSSGMYLRLAFSVAAHLEPEILLVDEVLAVGDAGFQRKCMNRMQEVGQEGRTVIFVSHNMQAVTRLCDRAILLHEGKVYEDGPARQVVSNYLHSGLGLTCLREWPDGNQAPGNEKVRLRAVRVKDEYGELASALDIRRPFYLEVEFDVLQSGTVVYPLLGFENEEGITLFVTIERDPRWRRKPRPAGRYYSRVHIPGNFFAEGTILCGGALITESPFICHCHERYLVAFQIVDAPDGSSARGDYGGNMPGVLRPMLDWQVEYLGEAQVAETPAGQQVQ